MNIKTYLNIYVLVIGVTIARYGPSILMSSSGNLSTNKKETADIELLGKLLRLFSTDCKAFQNYHNVILEGLLKVAPIDIL